MTRTVALIVAAGRGTRFGGPVPKQYRALGGRAVLARTIAAFRDHPAIDAVRVVIHPDDRARFDAAVAGLDPLPSVDGGASRQDSVRLGLESLAGDAPDLVLIHDAARPFLDAAAIDRVIAALSEAEGAIAALAVTDTIKRQDEDGNSAGTVDRTGLWRAQTPQGFRFPAILAAHRSAPAEGLTDDAAVAELAGLSVRLVPGDERNFKITTEADLIRAEAMLTDSPQSAPPAWEFRTGMGYDVHRFGPGDRVWLCGVELAHDHGLVGHSDADVGLHALTDAILGAIGAGDIGHHFPPSDPQWKGAPSDLFLAHAGRLVAERGGSIAQLDVTLICEKPKIGPYRTAMVARVGEILGLAPDRVSVKATTTERLGFAGRGEGMAAQAIATVRLPADGTG
ncbi:MAG: bifunctional 2-C-methyl-D-erythritol 4-phosphate cytidylyltransferase/2-C-methyl-D-erythritol 2,4-cyclodiphosphate synthase [Proteobacteria bacterium]|nr:bifunctional 2-C-methyl-D-erythritol 4-phosphate cytidylyltransferase/2-C-methyl-D-erythritol 2,4-cyclodiphosphate synthase [Pseudomonadota bacterium]